MNTLPTRCPLCEGELAITRIYCRDCDTTIEGRFVSGGPFSQLNSAQIEFLETFVRCEGKLSRMESELNLSYPTLRKSLHEIIRALGYEPGADEPLAQRLTPDARQRILEDLDQGRIDARTATRLLQEG